MNSTAVIVFVVAWIVIGLITGLWMARRGHSAMWTIVAVILGPLFVPIAFERAERRPVLAATGPEGVDSAGSASADERRLLVGLDGSAESERALAAAIELMGSRCGSVILAEVVSYDDASEGASGNEVEEATARLAAAASRLPGVRTNYEVLAGPPGEALRQFAEEQEVDLLVVSRRGRGLSKRLMGSVSSDLVQHAKVPVLVVEP
ncbi:hypothetical protein BFN03_07220 [Rhodococcus sp. WMMA185]|uniref:universal stress protein n=1 Tax=Rhodococcus sp. WMMA185 TaxID=679318 RepID=UPI000878FBB8|nr:universal stress protein [Rhodococcus sp. WMMA185]AOW92568.1 hypothetical protein BFN03_07220 [Rhodococcus sp. WMMA185]